MVCSHWLLPQGVLFATQVPDEEARQTKAWNHMFSIENGRLRGYNTPEMAHPRFNSWRRSLKEAGLEGASLKGTCQSNHSHGPYLSMANLASKKEALTLRLKTVSEKWLYTRAESKASDRGVEFDPACFSPEAELGEWLECASDDRRSRYVARCCLTVVFNIV